MLDRERILGKFDALEGYLKELRAIAPKSLKATKPLRKSRHACGFCKSRFKRKF
jgi:hypothetical protein